MVAEAKALVEKPLTEAQRIVARLESEFSMAPAAIANEIKLKSHIIHNIKTRHTTGNLQLPRLRRLLAVMEQGPTQTASPFAPNAPSFADIVPDIAIDPNEDPARFDVNAEEPTPAPQKKITERVSDWISAAMLGNSDPGSPAQPGMTAPPRKKKSDGESDAKTTFVDMTTPLASFLIALAIGSLIRDPYKAVGPTDGEIMLMLQPIVKRLARELDIKGKLTEDSLDGLTILLAIGIYGKRAKGTYDAIHAEEVKRAGTNNGGARFGVPGIPGDAAQPLAHDRASHPGADLGAHEPSANAHAAPGGGANGRSHAGAGNGSDRRANASITALLAADADGRKRLGIG